MGLDHPDLKCQQEMKDLTIFVSAEMRLGLQTWPGFSSLVHGHDPELVPFALAQSWNPRLQLIDDGAAVVIVRDQRVKPASELVLLLNDVVSDGPATIVSWLLPSQGHGLVVEVYNVRLLWSTWRL